MRAGVQWACLNLKTNMENSHNRNLSITNKSGKTGVYKNHDKWYAYITVNYNSIFLGSYDDFQDAVNARIAAEQQYGFTCDNIVADYDKID